jgi:glucan phosphoethanolaminetransferase (alkaline phosphatase superfamily)
MEYQSSILILIAWLAMCCAATATIWRRIGIESRKDVLVAWLFLFSYPFLVFLVLALLFPCSPPSWLLPHLIKLHQFDYAVIYID